MGTARFLLRRTLGMVAVLFLVSVITFLLIYLTPGSPEDAIIGSRRLNPELREAVRHAYGLDQSLFAQYWSWISDLAHLDFRTSYRTGEGVLDGISRRWSASAQLGLFSFLLTVLIGIPLGVLAALRRRGPVDRIASSAATFGVVFPPFVVAILLLYAFAAYLGWFPSSGLGDGPAGRLHSLVLPATAVAIGSTAVIMRITRASVIDELDEDHVAFAVGRGISQFRVMTRHVLRGALIPVVTTAGLLFIGLITGIVLIELAFGIDGLGSLFIRSIERRDIPMIQGVVVLIAALVVIGNLLVDLLYLAIDPRVRYDEVDK